MPLNATFEVKNTGSGPATNVKVAETLPAGMTTMDGATTYTFDAGTLTRVRAKPFSLGPPGRPSPAPTWIL